MKVIDFASYLPSSANDKPIDFILIDGWAHKLDRQHVQDELECYRCQSKTGFTFLHENNLYMWFCMTDDCLQYHRHLSAFYAKFDWEKKMGIKNQFTKDLQSNLMNDLNSHINGPRIDQNEKDDPTHQQI